MSILAIIVGLILLIKGGDWLLKSSIALSLNLSIPKAIIGMTVVSFATSTPELIVSVQSALNEHSDLVAGNMIGSNSANIGLVLAITLILSPIKVSSLFFRKEWAVMILSSVVFAVMLILDNQISSREGLFLFIGLILFIVFMLNKRKGENIIEDDDVEYQKLKKKEIIFYFILGSFILWLGSEILIKGAISLAESLGIGERVIGISIISVGTSIPELSASIMAIIRKEKAISLGNLIGSNIFNLLGVMGITSMIHPIVIYDDNLINQDLSWMLFFSFSLFMLYFIPKDGSLNRFNGVVLLVMYVYFITELFFS